MPKPRDRIAEKAFAIVEGGDDTLARDILHAQPDGLVIGNPAVETGRDLGTYRRVALVELFVHAVRR